MDCTLMYADVQEVHCTVVILEHCTLHSYKLYILILHTLVHSVHYTDISALYITICFPKQVVSPHLI